MLQQTGSRLPFLAITGMRKRPVLDAVLQSAHQLFPCPVAFLLRQHQREPVLPDGFVSGVPRQISGFPVEPPDNPPPVDHYSHDTDEIEKIADKSC